MDEQETTTTYQFPTMETQFPAPYGEEDDEHDMEYRWRIMGAWRRRTEHDDGDDDDEMWRRRRGGEVMLEGYVEASTDGSGDDEGSEGVARTKSLTDDDLEELKGCFDLGFGFSYDEIPELCNTLPALELCYSMSQRFLDERQQRSPRVSLDENEAVDQGSSMVAAPVANWRILSPGDNPDEVKARLRYWAQAVACTVRLCS